MPDHFHALVSLDAGITVERAVQLVKGGFSFRAGKELGFREEIWQRGFTDHLIRGAEDFQNHVAYIRDTPIKGGLAARAEDYPYSSAFSGLVLDAPPSQFRG